MAFALTNQSGTLMSNGPTDTCLTPAAPSPVPTPYPNIGMMTQASGGTLSSKVKIAGSKAATKKTEISTSSGDEAGTNGGIVSAKNMGPVTFSKGSGKVKIEGNPAVRLGDATKHNGKPNSNTVGSASAPSQSKVDIGG